MTTKKILVVDNEEYIQEVTKISLETTAGWQVITASSGTEGIHQAKTEKPDVILLDVMMPDLDGFTTLKLLQSNSDTQEIPVILLTAKLDTDRQYYTDLNTKGAIAKPFSPLSLADEIATILGWKV